MMPEKHGLETHRIRDCQWRVSHQIQIQSWSWKRPKPVPQQHPTAQYNSARVGSCPDAAKQIRAIGGELQLRALNC